MKTPASLLFFLLCLILPSAAETPPLKVISWNMEWFPGKRPTASASEAEAHMKAGQEALKAMDPDVFIGVEITDWDAFHQVCSVVPGLTVHVVSSFVDPQSGEIRPQQIGIASKLKCHGAWWEAWKANVPNISRGFSFAALEPRDGGGLIMIYGNHLKSNRGSDTPEGAKNVGDMRNEQANQLLRHMKEMTTAYGNQPIKGWIAGGDFNTNHDGQFPQCHAVEILTKAGFYNTWLNVPKEKRLTWRTEPGGRFDPTTFDYLFTKGFGELTATTVAQDTSVSDHLPVQLLLPASKP
jgi:endonuclease/exonuclease/phosphatase family metal-dependent hydrolase